MLSLLLLPFLLLPFFIFILQRGWPLVKNFPFGMSTGHLSANHNQGCTTTKKKKENIKD